MKTVNTARNVVHEVRTLEGQYPIQISMYWTMKSIGERHLRHINMPQRLDRFAFQSLKMENTKMYAIWSPCRLCNDHYISMKRPTATNLQMLKFLMELTVKQETCWNAVWPCACGRAAGTRAKMRSRERKESSAQEVRGYSKPFFEATHLEYSSWVDGKVFWSHWLEEGNAEKLCHRTVGSYHQDRPASTRPGLRMSYQMSAKKWWNLFSPWSQNSILTRTIL